MKKILFIIIAIIAVVAIWSSGKKDQSSSSTSSTSQSSQGEKKETNETTLGTPITFDGEIEVTVKTAVWTDERNQFEEKQPQKVLLVTYDVKNLSNKDYPLGTELKLYVNGKKAETYPIQVTLDSISSGRTFENATQAFAVNETGDLELEVQPFISSKPKKIIKLNL